MTKEIRYFQNYLSNNKNLSIKTINAYTTDLLLLEEFLNNKNTPITSRAIGKEYLFNVWNLPGLER